MSFQRVEVIKDVYWASGKLKVEKGATGYISSMNEGYVGVVFDDGKFVDLDGGGRRIQEVPYRWVKEIYTNVGTPGHVDL